MTSTLPDLTAKLVSIDSTNPSLVSSGAGEAEIAAFVADWCRDQALDVRIIEADGRPNVVAVAKGTGGGRSIILNGHLDTVGVDGMDDPFRPRVEDGRMYGRGVIDMKASIAAMMATLARVRRNPLRGDVVMTAVADERLQRRTPPCGQRREADAAIVTDPQAGTVVRLTRILMADVIAQGRAAHGSCLARGSMPSEVGALLQVLKSPNALQKPRVIRVGPGFGACFGTISGGREMSSSPATFTWARKAHDPG